MAIAHRPCPNIACDVGTPPARPSPSASPEPSPEPSPGASPSPDSPPTPGTSPPPPSGGSCGKEVTVWEACGGRSNGCSGDQCKDAQWKVSDAAVRVCHMSSATGNSLMLLTLSYRLVTVPCERPAKVSPMRIITLGQRHHGPFVLQNHCCSSGTTCTRINEWFWQCLPSTKSPVASAAVVSNTTVAPVVNCSTAVEVWEPCGGAGDDCPRDLRSHGKCGDTVWEVGNLV